MMQIRIFYILIVLVILSVKSLKSSDVQAMNTSDALMGNTTIKTTLDRSLFVNGRRADTDESESSKFSSEQEKESEEGPTTELHGITSRPKKRQCEPCGDELALNYKNVKLKWICGAYQRARRSFKSPCMMRFRNCQDGTMFVKIHDLRCKDDPVEENMSQKHGRHFFYQYDVSSSEQESSALSVSQE